MAYSFDPATTSVEEELRRVARSQIERALGTLEDPDASRDERVHAVRKRCKKLVGLVRLMRPTFPGHDEEHAAYRAALAPLSAARDDAALDGTIDGILARFRRQVDPGAFARVRARLAQARPRATASEVDEALAAAREQLAAALRRTPDWTLEEEGFAALEGGLRRGYRRASSAMDACAHEGDAESFHRWRKRVKEHAQHARLLRRAVRGALDEHVVDAVTLTRDLGEHHDLFVLDGALAGVDVRGSDEVETSIELLRGICVGRQHALERTTLQRGEQLFDARPSAMVKRWRNDWTGCAGRD